MSTILSWLRVIVFVTTNLFSVIVLGIAAHLTSLTAQFLNFYFIFAALAIATAVLNLFSLPAFLMIDRTRHGAFTSMVVVELSWLFVLWVLWLATGADAASGNSVTFNGNCGAFSGDLGTACSEIQAIEAFGLLNWILLFGYSIAILVFAIKASSEGRAAWTVGVKDLTWSDGAVATEKGGLSPAPMSAGSPVYPPTLPYSPPSGYSHPTGQGYPGGFPVPEVQAQHAPNHYPPA